MQNKILEFHGNPLNEAQIGGNSDKKRSFFKANIKRFQSEVNQQ